MPLNRVRKFSRRIEFKLTFWYAVVFIISWLGLFLAGFAMLETSILSRDRQIITGLINNYALVAKTNGVDQLIRNLEQETLAHIADGQFIMVADQVDKILHITMPYGWAAPGQKARQTLFDFQSGQLYNYLRTDRYTHIGHSVTGQDELEIQVRELPDGCRIWLGHSAESREEYLESFRDTFFLVTLMVVLISVVMGTFMAWRSMAPVRALERTVNRVISGRMQARIPLIDREGELEGLAGQFNRMLDRNEELIKAMGEALDNVAHDLRTPLTRMGIAIERNVMEEDPQKLKEALFDCAEESQRISRMLTTLMDISEAETGAMTLHYTRIDLALLFDEVIDIYEFWAGDKEISLISSCPPDLWMEADNDRLRQVMCNLVDNAVKYSPKGTRVNITAQGIAQSLEIRVTDRGRGIAHGDAPKIFDRLYRCDHSRNTKGSGLGLSLVKAVVQAHKGSISVESEPGKGSVFTLSFPK